MNHKGPTQGADRELKTELEGKGYAAIENVVGPERLAAFEAAIEQFAAGELKRRGLPRRHEDALHDLMLSDDGYREALFPMLKYLKIVQLICAEVGQRLTDSGLLKDLGFETPLIWPSMRADPPDESIFILPLHQDLRSTRCSRGLRLWVPLRDANRRNGTMRLIPGSHRHGPLPHDEEHDSRFGRTIGKRFYDGKAEHVVEIKAGDGVLFNPLLIHGSVAGVGERMKFVMLIQVQDLSTLMYDPSLTSVSSHSSAAS